MTVRLHRNAQFSEDIAGEGLKVFAAAEPLGLEGIVSKRIGSHY